MFVFLASKTKNQDGTKLGTPKSIRPIISLNKNLVEQKSGNLSGFLSILILDQPNLYAMRIKGSLNLKENTSEKNSRKLISNQ